MTDQFSDQSSDNTHDNDDLLQQQRLVEHLQAAGAKLHMHFDCIQIFAAFQAGDKTFSHSFGIGSTPTRYAMTREFIIQHEERLREITRRSLSSD